MELAEQIAMRFHFWYESLAPKYDYATRKESHVEWDQVPENNRSLMVAVARQVADEFAICETEEAVDTTPNTVSDKICICNGCIVENCNMRGDAVECSGHVTENGKLRT